MTITHTYDNGVAFYSIFTASSICVTSRPNIMQYPVYERVRIPAPIYNQRSVPSSDHSNMIPTIYQTYLQHH